ncbi:polysaccharide pyruvyl transferase family protein [Bacillus carboniphilus]|uniref:Polysaccharide pyruvyl transferase family protein n=1 Tax=Bacillus carboniphilus TaxID=86663 RepID=A0ABY9JV95_9BACI|nr:polysaccharide pyruvyl transferase family protein [Bacillus carboniphilus]WLR41570.1 polysaccharide pyruvyl transferase family protein [Bacillus carboniphilus]
MKEILVCGVANSANLGDRIIAETVNYIIHSTNELTQIYNFDLTDGKVRDFDNKSIIKLNSTGLLKQLTPDYMRRLKVYRKYKKNRGLETELKKSVAKADLIVIGGGHLLIDNYLNFPIGISNIIKEARLNNIPVIFAFVGAKGPWSKTAKKLLLDALEYADYISVRDSESRRFLVSLSESLSNKVVTLSDPAIFVNDMIGDDEKNTHTKTTKIGLGIMDPNVIRRHSKYRWSREDAKIWWVSLAKKLSARGYEVNIFTNGASTDNGFVEYFIKKELATVEKVSFLDYPTSYKDVLSCIQKQDVVIAQRLHACLPSISLMKQTFGLVWDIKLKSIYNELGLSDYIIDFNEEVDIVINKIINKLEQNHHLDTQVIENINVRKRELLDFVKRGVGEKD